MARTKEIISLDAHAESILDNLTQAIATLKALRAKVNDMVESGIK